jgi:tetratricopeptide (TPR) repeat protein
LLGEVALGMGDHAAAEPHFERELAEASQAGQVSWQTHAYNMLGQTARLQGEFRRADSLLWQALKLFRAAGEPHRSPRLSRYWQKIDRPDRRLGSVWSCTKV